MNHLINYIPLPCILVEGPEHSITAFNPEALKLFRIADQETYLGHSIHQHIRKLALISNTHYFKKLEAFDQSIHAVEAHMEKVSDNGSFHHLYTFKLQHKLKYEFKEVFEAASDGILLINKRLKVLNANPAFCRMTGLDKEDVVGKGGLKLARKHLTKEHFGLAFNALKSLAKRKAVLPYEVYFNNRYLSISSNMSYATSFYVAIFRDVTEQHKAQEKLQEKELRYRSLIESMRDAVFVLHNHQIVFANSQLEIDSGLSKEELMGKNFLDFVADGEKEKVKNFYYKRIQNSTAPKKYESVAVNKKGVHIPVEVSIEEILFDNKPSHLVVIRNVSEQKKALNIIRQSEENFRLLAANTFDGILINDAKGKYLYANAQAEHITGYKAEELKQITAFDLTPVRLHNELSKRIDNQFNKNYNFSSLEFTLLSKKGKEIPVQVTASGTRWLGEKAQIITIRDLSPHKQAEEEKRQIEQKYKELTELLPEIVFETDKHLNVSFTNRIAEDRLGFSSEDIIQGRINLHDLICEEDKKRFFDNAYKSLRGIPSSGNTYRVILPGGEPKYFQFFNNPIYSGKEISGLRGIAVDVSEQKIAENELKKSKNLLHTILENIPGGFMLIDENRIIQLVNQETCRLTGYVKEELEGQNCEMIRPKDYQFSKEDQTQSNVESHLVCSNGDRLPILRNAHTLSVESKTYLVESFVDIRKQKENEESLLQAIRKAEEADKLKSAFLANMSHEIRTPMNGIIGFTSLLKSRDLTEEKRNLFIDTIEKSGFRLLNTVNDLLEISRIEAGQMKMYYERVNIHVILNDHFDFFRQEAQAKGLGMLLKSPEAPRHHGYMYTDVNKLNSIISNILKNAIKFTEQGKIEMGYKIIDDTLVFYCKDEGIGIPEERQKAIFNRFEQADLDNLQANQGSGLGLAIVKAYVLMLNGDIQLKSSEGSGSTFTVKLPLHSDS